MSLGDIQSQVPGRVTDGGIDSKGTVQYDVIGAKYLEAQNKFYLPRNDWARDFVRTPIFAHEKYKILDLGCGDGADVAFFESRGHNVFGIDESNCMLDQAATRVRQPNNLFRTPIEKLFALNRSNRGLFTEGKWGNFDYIFARYSLHYVLGNIDEIFMGVNFALKDNGVFAFVVPNPVADIPFTDTKDYSTAKKVRVKIFNDQLEISYPFRKMDELITLYLCENFRVRQFEYYPDGYNGNSSIPSAIAVVAQKPESKHSMWIVGAKESYLETQIIKAFERRQRLMSIGEKEIHADNL